MSQTNVRAAMVLFLITLMLPQIFTARRGSYFEALPESLTSAKCHPYNQFAIINSPNDDKVNVDVAGMLNPNSYANITTHIKRTGKQAGIENYSSGKPKWMFFETAATIYRILLKSLKIQISVFVAKLLSTARRNFKLMIVFYVIAHVALTNLTGSLKCLAFSIKR